MGYGANVSGANTQYAGAYGHGHFRNIGFILVLFILLVIISCTIIC